jgi:hypothetical protein
MHLYTGNRRKLPRGQSDVTVNVTVSNTGVYDGWEVVQLYVECVADACTDTQEQVCSMSVECVLLLECVDACTDTQEQVCSMSVVSLSVPHVEPLMYVYIKICIRVCVCVCVCLCE